MVREPYEEQRRALDSIVKWYRNVDRNDPLTFGGLAGTGKTTVLTLVPNFVGLPDSKVLYLAPTNQAANVLRNKLSEVGVKSPVRTIHKAIKTTRPIHCLECPVVADTRVECHNPTEVTNCFCEPTFDTKDPDRDYPLVICDESSMITEELYDDLLNIRYRPKLLFAGDHGQLPPVDSDGFNLMEAPEIQLIEPRRQAKDSAIIQLAYQARNNAEIPVGEYGPGVRKIDIGSANFDVDDPDNTIIINWFVNSPRVQTKNAYTCTKLNQIWRQAHGRTGPPQPGDRVRAIRVRPKHGISKGTIGTITKIKYVGQEKYAAEIVINDRPFPYQAEISARQFDVNYEMRGMYDRDLWEYGYAITCQKAQGSEFESVIVIEPPEYFRSKPEYEYSRWLYTAITRAKKQLTIVG